ncbi:MAG: MATE family efflux transporter, partial [Eubacteriales bacterium]
GFFGSSEYGKMKTAVFTTLISSAVICGALMIFGFTLSGTLLHAINTPENVMADSELYLDIYVLGLPFLFFYNISTGIFAAMGDSRTPFIFLASSSTANIAMDILFVKYFNMGVSGVAWATFICQGISCVLAVIFALTRISKIKCTEKIKIFSFQILGKISLIAVPSILQQSFISVGNILIQGIINTFDTGVMAGYGAAVKLNNIVITSFSTIGNGISNYTAQNLGAKKEERIRPGFMAGALLMLCICVPVIIAYTSAGKFLVMLFMEDPTEQALGTGVLFLRILSPFYLVISMKLLADGVLRGAGQMNKFMAATFTDLILRVVLAKLLSDIMASSVGIWLAWPIGWCISTVISLVFYKKGYWNKKIAKEKIPEEEKTS